MGRDEFRRAVETVGHGPSLTWPVTGEDVIGLTTKKEVKPFALRRHDRFADGGVVKRGCPAAKTKATTGVFIRPARCLNDAVEGNVFDDF